MATKITIIVLLLFLTASVLLNVYLYKNTGLQITNDPSQQSTVSPSISPPLTPKSDDPELPENKSETVLIGDTFTIPIKNPEVDMTEEIAYTLSSYEIAKEIMVNGQTAQAIPGRTFFVVDIQITNPLERVIEIKSSDYLKLSVNNSDSYLAPDIHSDPLVVQPKSSKFTRLGFPINTSDKDFSLQFGEPDGAKEIIDL
jgi:hypothetical protein